MVDNISERLRVLRLVDTMAETSAPYNQFTLAWADKHDITMCSFFEPRVSAPRSITVFGGDGSVRGFFAALKAALNEKTYDVVHVHSFYCGVFLLAARMFMWGKTRLAPAVFTVHDTFPDFKVKHKLMLVPIMLLFRKIVCCGRASFMSMPWFYRWLAGKRLCFVPNGVNIQRVDRVIKRLPEQSGTRPFTVAVIGRLFKVKAHSVALSAFGQIDDQTSRLILMGDGPLRENLMAQIDEMGLARRVEMTGIVERDKVFEYLVNSDLFVSASLGEGLPIAVLEAMACRCPVVLSDIAPHREIADGADFVSLVPPGDVAGFAREIERLRNMSVAERAGIGEKCRKLVEERFDLQSMRKAYEEVYLEAISGR